MRLIQPPKGSVDREIIVNADHITKVTVRQVPLEEGFFRVDKWGWAWGVSLSSDNWVEWGRCDNKADAQASRNQLAASLIDGFVWES